MSRSILAVGYQPAASGVPLEVLGMRDLRSRMPPGHRVRVERLSFHVVVLVTAGSGTHEVDFEMVELAPGRVLHVRPGQVHRWGPDTYDARLLLFPSSPVLPAWTSGPPWSDPPVADWVAGTALVDWVVSLPPAPAADLRRSRQLAGVRDLLVATLRLDETSPVGSAHLLEPYVAVRARLAGEPPWPRSVLELASELGYSERTLTRACQVATALTAKRLLDERVALEARRLLAHTDRPVAVLATELGFSEHTNFTKFFERTTGTTPAAWRASVRAWR
jgi:AraC-like DNA-binding protein